jgi:hypothetical protein
MTVELADIFAAMHSAAKGRAKRRDFAAVLRADFRYARDLQRDLATDRWQQRISYRQGTVTNANGKQRTTHQPDCHTLILQHLCIAMLRPFYAAADPLVGLNCKDGCGLTARRKRLSVSHRLKHVFYDRRDLNYLLKIDQRKCYDHITPKSVRRALKAIHVPQPLLDFAVTLGFVDNRTFPVGTPLSPLLHHIVQLSTDRLLRELSPTAVRYADDHILFFATKEEANAAKWRLKNLWWYELGIRAKRNTVTIQPMTLPCDFCGTVYHRNPDKQWHDHNKGYTIIRKSTAERAAKNNNPKSYPSYFGTIAHTDGYNLLKALEQVNLQALTEKIRIDRALDAPQITVKELADNAVEFCIHDYDLRADKDGHYNWVKCLISFRDPRSHRRLMREYHGGYQGLVDFHAKVQQTYSKDEILPLAKVRVHNACGYIYVGSSNMQTECEDRPEFN